MKPFLVVTLNQPLFSCSMFRTPSPWRNAPRPQGIRISASNFEARGGAQRGVSDGIDELLRRIECPRRCDLYPHVEHIDPFAALRAPQAVLLFSVSPGLRSVHHVYPPSPLILSLLCAGHVYLIFQHKVIEREASDPWSSTIFT